jgi:hypothetical protein
MRMVERYRAEIVVLLVLPISFLIYLTKLLKRWLFAPSPVLHSSRVERVCADVVRFGGTAATSPRRAASIPSTAAIGPSIALCTARLR